MEQLQSELVVAGKERRLQSAKTMREKKKLLSNGSGSGNREKLIPLHSLPNRLDVIPLVLTQEIQSHCLYRFVQYHYTTTIISTAVAEKTSISNGRCRCNRQK